ncbi:MAG: hypothetical protein Harvfovirus33_3 [Harvfovirus sp.]|uniref:Uncharacterized protein n=1 Tax=Harvfovirus sp. TaxID=2487768 RepID=A0A3G5A2K3_9VIRU|nr:MAG: hypothetical protein Harvfovirus33_3 [Harvfovirus sp.]
MTESKENSGSGGVAVESKAEKWLGQLNYKDLVAFCGSCLDKGKKFYSQNKKIGDLTMSFVCFILVLGGWVDLEIIGTFYFLGLVYMTAKAIMGIYGKIGGLVAPIAVEEDKNTEVAPTLLGLIERLERKDVNECLHEFTTLGNNFMIYASLVACDYLILFLNSWMNKVVFNVIFTVGRFVCYMYFCNLFVPTMETNSESVKLSVTHWSSSEAEYNKSMPVPTRRLITFMAINNIASYYLFAVGNFKILKIITKGSTNVVDTFQTVWNQFFMKNSTVSNVAKAAGNANFFKSVTDKFKSWRKQK